MESADPILSVARMRAAEQALIDDGTTVSDLMDRAGQGAAAWVWRLAGRARVTVLCGPGNNGGDGYVIARELRQHGAHVTVVAPLAPTTDAARSARDLYDGPIETEASGDVLVDCLFGSGLTRPLSGDLAMLLSQLATAHDCRVAIDLPSGIDADAASPLNSGLPRYDLTLALGAWKPAHWLMPACATMGERRLVPIGVQAPVGVPFRLGRPNLSPPLAGAHKYTRGLVAVASGAMPGASALAAEAAARGGAGYVRLVGMRPPKDLSHAIVAREQDDFDKAAAVLVGPGLGRDDRAGARLSQALNSGVAVVADADALALDAVLRAGPAPAIVTPHEGEFARLFGSGAGNKIERTVAAAKDLGSVVVHKGPDTVIAAPDGRVAVSAGTTSWLSAAGTGDVLAGLCAARLAVTGDPFRAACEAAWLHGEAARMAGPAFVADDLIAHIPSALAVCL